jgi:DNA-binding transcriptional MerR regulator
LFFWVTAGEATLDELTRAGFSGTRTAEIVGITYRQLDYWARTDLVRPSISDAKGSGSRRLYSYTDLVQLKLIKRLLDAGIKLESVRDVFEELRAHVGDEIASANLVIDGSTAVLALDDGMLIDLVRRGQGVLNVVSLGNVKEEVDASIADISAPTNGAGRDRGKRKPQVASGG